MIVLSDARSVAPLESGGKDFLVARGRRAVAGCRAA